MARNSAPDLSSRLWAYLLGSLRVLLFIACILLSTSQMANIYYAWNRSDRFMLVHYMQANTFNVGLDTYLVYITLTLAGVQGAYAAYSRNSKYLMIFVVNMFIWSVALFVMGATTMISLEEDQNLFKAKMHLHGMSYKFDSSPTDDLLESTRALDSIQSILGCCGFNDHKDWKIWRSGRDTMIPQSCCDTDPLGIFGACSEKNELLFKEGCGIKMAMIHSAIPAAHLLNSLWYLLLASSSLLLLTRRDYAENTSKARKQTEKIPTAPIAYL